MGDEPPLFRANPREYALKMVEDGDVTAEHMLMCCIKSMSHDEIRAMLDANELSPRFYPEPDDD